MSTSAVLIALFFASHTWAVPPPLIRVLISETPKATIEGIDTPMQISFGNEPKAMSYRASSRMSITAGPKGLMLEGEPIGEEARLQNRTRRYEIDDKLFKGEIRVVWKSDGKLLVIDALPLEDYLVGLLGSEMYPGWPIEAYKAQAIAARTYALHHAEAADNATAREYDVTSTVLSQVYDGINREADSAKEAVKATEGLVLMHEGKLFPAFYHSCCGGQTEYAHNVWSGEWGPQQVSDRFCERSPKRKWSATIPTREFIDTLGRNGIAIDGIKSITVRPELDSPRVDRVIVEHAGGTAAIKATDLRSMFGYAKIKSTWFDAKTDKGSIVFNGRGYGHGVGMCQWGAKGMAEEGADYRQILNFYYAGTEIRKTY